MYFVEKEFSFELQYISIIRKHLSVNTGFVDNGTSYELFERHSSFLPN